MAETVSLTMQVNTHSTKVRIGRKNFPSRPEKTELADFYDSNYDGTVTLQEIQDKRASGSDESLLTSHDRDNAISVRQSLAGLPSPYIDSYPSLAEIEQSLSSLESKYEGQAEVVVIGQSVEGRDIKALRVSNDIDKASTEDKPSVIITGNLHAREWATNMAVTRAAEKVLDGEAADSLDKTEMWFVPCVNPDGYEHSRNTDTMWRKNTWVNRAGEMKGIDLNRQFPHQFRPYGDLATDSFDDIGASDDPNDETYRGRSPLSTPEAQAVMNLIDQEESAVGLLDVHSYGQVLLSPGGQREVSIEEYTHVGYEMNQAMKDKDYKVIAADDLYPTSGQLADYADSMGIVAMTMEAGDAFQPNPKALPGIVDRASDGIVEFVELMGKRV